MYIIVLFINPYSATDALGRPELVINGRPLGALRVNYYAHLNFTHTVSPRIKVRVLLCEIRWLWAPSQNDFKSHRRTCTCTGALSTPPKNTSRYTPYDLP